MYKKLEKAWTSLENVDPLSRNEVSSTWWDSNLSSSSRRTPYPLNHVWTPEIPEYTVLLVTKVLKKNRTFKIILCVHENDWCTRDFVMAILLQGEAFNWTPLLKNKRGPIVSWSSGSTWLALTLTPLPFLVPTSHINMSTSSFFFIISSMHDTKDKVILC